MPTDVPSPRAPLAALVLLIGLAAHGPQVLGADEPAPVSPADPETPRIARETRGGRFSLFEDVIVPAGVVHDGDVVCLFGTARIEGEVTRDVVVVGGELVLSGRVGRGVVGVLSTIVVSEGARIERELVAVVSSLDNRGSVGRDIVHIPLPFRDFSLRAPLGALGALVAWAALVWTLIGFVLVLLVAAIAPDRVRIIGDEAPMSYLLAFLAGIAGYVGLWVVNTLLILTVIGIPLCALLYLAFVVVKWLGLAGVYRHVGRGLGRLAGRELSLLASVLLGFLPFALLLVLPLFLGGIGILAGIGLRLLYWLLLEIPAVGLAILTRLGSQPRRPPGLIAPPGAAPPGP